MGIIGYFLPIFVAVIAGVATEPHVGYLAYAFSGDYKDNYPCPGVILSERYVLTTATCICEKPNLIVMAGDSPERNKTAVFSPVFAKYIHRDFEEKRLHSRVENSMAILVLSEKLPFSSNIFKVSLPTNQIQAHQNITVSGWIALCSWPPLKRIIHRSLVSADPELCVGIQPDEFCVEDSPSTRKVTYGSPVVFNNIFLGFTTFSCSSGPPTVTSVWSYIDFIRDISDPTITPYRNL